ncbi:hypothetical protein M0811_12182 [Anaeramoeba ignava]|uniref:Uncharacterized protein n=1 Tax=Anaeramoeba ignava TaxID=1746090 RepID=A0A9Q0R6X9_ANAIG|nr:hypothetical protein M0811_12182 [Anaeramoeba ignava]
MNNINQYQKLNNELLQLKKELQNQLQNLPQTDPKLKKLVINFCQLTLNQKQIQQKITNFKKQISKLTTSFWRVEKIIKEDIIYYKVKIDTEIALNSKFENLRKIFHNELFKTFSEKKIIQIKTQLLITNILRDFMEMMQKNQQILKQTQLLKNTISDLVLIQTKYVVKIFTRIINKGSRNTKQEQARHPLLNEIPLDNEQLNGFIEDGFVFWPEKKKFENGNQNEIISIYDENFRNSGYFIDIIQPLESWIKSLALCLASTSTIENLYFLFISLLNCPGCGLWIKDIIPTKFTWNFENANYFSVILDDISHLFDLKVESINKNFRKSEKKIPILSPFKKDNYFLSPKHTSDSHHAFMLNSFEKDFGLFLISLPLMDFLNFICSPSFKSNQDSDSNLDEYFDFIRISSYFSKILSLLSRCLSSNKDNLVISYIGGIICVIGYNLDKMMFNLENHSKNPQNADDYYQYQIQFQSIFDDLMLDIFGICINYTKKLWKHLKNLQYRFLSEKTLWKILYLIFTYSEKTQKQKYSSQHVDISSLGDWERFIFKDLKKKHFLVTPQKVEYEENLVSLQFTPVRNNFHQNIRFQKESHLIYALEKIASSGHPEVSKCIFLEFFIIGYFSGENLNFKGLIFQETEKIIAEIFVQYPSFFSILIHLWNRYHSQIEKKKAISFYKFPIQSWKPTQNDFEILESWLCESQDDELAKIARFVMENLNWGIDEGSNDMDSEKKSRKENKRSLFIDPKLHQKCLIIITKYWINLKTATKEPNQQLMEWCWKIAYKISVFSELGELRVPQFSLAQENKEINQEIDFLLSYIKLSKHLDEFICYSTCFLTDILTDTSPQSKTLNLKLRTNILSLLNTPSSFFSFNQILFHQIPLIINSYISTEKTNQDTSKKQYDSSPHFTGNTPSLSYSAHAAHFISEYLSLMQFVKKGSKEYAAVPLERGIKMDPSLAKKIPPYKLLLNTAVSMIAHRINYSKSSQTKQTPNQKKPNKTKEYELKSPESMLAFWIQFYSLFNEWWNIDRIRESFNALFQIAFIFGLRSVVRDFLIAQFLPNQLNRKKSDLAMVLNVNYQIEKTNYDISIFDYDSFFDFKKTPANLKKDLINNYPFFLFEFIQVETEKESEIRQLIGQILLNPKNDMSKIRKEKKIIKHLNCISWWVEFAVKSSPKNNPLLPLIWRNVFQLYCSFLNTRNYSGNKQFQDLWFGHKIFELAFNQNEFRKVLKESLENFVAELIENSEQNPDLLGLLSSMMFFLAEDSKTIKITSFIAKYSQFQLIFDEESQSFGAKTTPITNQIEHNRQMFWLNAVSKQSLFTKFIPFISLYCYSDPKKIERLQLFISSKQEGNQTNAPKNETNQKTPSKQNLRLEPKNVPNSPSFMQNPKLKKIIEKSILISDLFSFNKSNYFDLQTPINFHLKKIKESSFIFYNKWKNLYQKDLEFLNLLPKLFQNIPFKKMKKFREKSMNNLTIEGAPTHHLAFNNSMPNPIHHSYSINPTSSYMEYINQDNPKVFVQNHISINTRILSLISKNRKYAQELFDIFEKSEPIITEKLVYSIFFIKIFVKKILPKTPIPQINSPNFAKENEKKDDDHNDKDTIFQHPSQFQKEELQIWLDRFLQFQSKEIVFFPPSFQLFTQIFRKIFNIIGTDPRLIFSKISKYPLSCPFILSYFHPESDPKTFPDLYAEFFHLYLLEKTKSNVSIFNSVLNKFDFDSWISQNIKSPKTDLINLFKKLLFAYQSALKKQSHVAFEHLSNSIEKLIEIIPEEKFVDLFQLILEKTLENIVDHKIWDFVDNFISLNKSAQILVSVSQVFSTKTSEFFQKEQMKWKKSFSYPLNLNVYFKKFEQFLQILLNGFASQFQSESITFQELLDYLWLIYKPFLIDATKNEKVLRKKSRNFNPKEKEEEEEEQIFSSFFAHFSDFKIKDPMLACSHILGKFLCSVSSENVFSKLFVKKFISNILVPNLEISKELLVDILQVFSFLQMNLLQPIFKLVDWENFQKEYSSSQKDIEVVLFNSLLNLMMRKEKSRLSHKMKKQFQLFISQIISVLDWQSVDSSTYSQALQRVDLDQQTILSSFNKFDIILIGKTINHENLELLPLIFQLFISVGNFEKQKNSHNLELYLQKAISYFEKVFTSKEKQDLVVEMKRNANFYYQNLLLIEKNQHLFKIEKQNETKIVEILKFAFGIVNDFSSQYLVPYILKFIQQSPSLIPYFFQSTCQMEMDQIITGALFETAIETFFAQKETTVGNLVEILHFSGFEKFLEQTEFLDCCCIYGYIFTLCFMLVFQYKFENAENQKSLNHLENQITTSLNFMTPQPNEEFKVILIVDFWLNYVRNSPRFGNDIFSQKQEQTTTNMIRKLTEINDPSRIQSLSTFQHPFSQNETKESNEKDSREEARFALFLLIHFFDSSLKISRQFRKISPNFFQFQAGLLQDVESTNQFQISAQNFLQKVKQNQTHLLFQETVIQIFSVFLKFNGISSLIDLISLISNNLINKLFERFWDLPKHKHKHKHKHKQNDKQNENEKDNEKQKEKEKDKQKDKDNEKEKQKEKQKEKEK